MPDISNKYYAPRVLRVPENTLGRDFVIGDIHGAYDVVVSALRKAKFHPEKDRLFSVGDLIDRGAGSYRCANFLSKDYVFALRGNHEDMLIDLYQSEAPSPEVLSVMAQFNGFGWWLDTEEPLRQEILSKIRRLPLVIEIETSRGLVGLTHADVPAKLSWPEFVVKVEAGDTATIKTALWGRARTQSRNSDGVLGVGRVFVGHTPQWDGATRYGNVYAIDTGAIYGAESLKQKGHLTMVNLVARTNIIGPFSAEFPLLNICDVQGYPESAPFGSYAKAA